jgi:phosphatidylserine decarboxylase
VFGFYEYDTPLQTFTPTRYGKFYDWFLRELSPQAKVAARYRASFSRVCSPVEALIRYEGKVGDGSIELKNGEANILHALQGLVPQVGNYNFLKLNLRKCFYHRVHSPVGGVVTDITRHPQGTGAFGDNSVTCITINSPKPVFLCAIGEKTVQSFNCLPKVGDKLNKLDEVGWFWWGSMVLLAVPPEMKFSENLPEKLFVGDPLL